MKYFSKKCLIFFFGWSTIFEIFKSDAKEGDSPEVSEFLFCRLFLGGCYGKKSD